MGLFRTLPIKRQERKEHRKMLRLAEWSKALKALILRVDVV